MIIFKWPFKRNKYVLNSKELLLTAYISDYKSRLNLCE